MRVLDHRWTGTMERRRLLLGARPQYPTAFVARAMPYHSKWQSLPTEAINAATLGIDTMPVLDIVDLMTQEDKKVVAAVHKERERIAYGVDLIAGALKKGGRLFLVGAGTSGRLCLVEAIEMPLTFGTPPKL